jgi:hypothetical protein
MYDFLVYDCIVRVHLAYYELCFALAARNLQLADFRENVRE